MENIAEFLERCDAYRAARGISEARLSTILFNDGKKLGALRGGADVGVRRMGEAVTDLAALEARQAEGAAS